MHRLGIYILGILLLLSSPMLHAQFRAEINGMTSAGYTTDRNPGSGQEPVGDGFVETGVGLSLISSGPRALHILRYELNTMIFMDSADATSFGNILSYISLYELSERMRFGFNVSLTQGRQGNLFAEGQDQLGQARRSGTVWYMGLRALERIEYSYTNRITLFQSLQNDWYIPTDNPIGDDGDLENGWGARTSNINLGFGARRRWSRFSLSLQQHTQYLVTFIDEEAQITTEASWLLGLSTTASYDFSDTWNGSLEVGVQTSASGSLDEFEQPGPLAIARARYRTPRFRLNLAVGYQQNPNAQVAYVMEGAFANTNIEIPIGPLRWRFRFDAGAGYTYSSPVGEVREGDLQPDIATTNADAALIWRFSNYAESALRYRLAVQRSSLPEPLPANAGTTIAQDYTVHMVLLSLRFNFPERQRAQRRLPSSTGAPADREEWDSVFDPNPAGSPGGQLNEVDSENPLE